MYYILVFFFYVWLTASFIITYQMSENEHLLGWEKLVVFFFWPITAPFGLLIEFIDWLKR